MNFFAPSTWWIVLIALGAVLVAVGNINYNLARDREKSELASKKALSMLTAESRRNLERIQQMREAMKSGQIRIEGFEATAWSVVASGGLLVQMEPQTLEDITGIYYLIELAGKYHSHILDMATGVLSALGGVEHTRAQYLELLKGTLDQLEPKLKNLIEKQGSIQAKSQGTARANTLALSS
jgi:hypothetical protein